MIKVFKIDGSEYSKNLNVLSDLLKRREVDMVITTYQRNADDPAKDGLVLLPKFAARNNEALMTACGDHTMGQMTLGYEINSVPYYKSEFGAARVIDANQDAWGKDTVDMVAFPAAQLENFGYDAADFNYVDASVLEKSTAPTVEFSRVAVLNEQGSRAHFAERTVLDSAEGKEVLSFVEAQLGPKDAKAIQGLFKLCDQYGMSLSQMLPLIKKVVETHNRPIVDTHNTLDTLG